jgi:acyl dehydratase
MGVEIEPRSYRVTRADLVAYAAASGDQNPIHQDEDVARSVGLPGVIAHGMYTLALAARYVDEYVGAPGRIAELGAKFTKPVVVPAGDDGAEVTVSGVLEVRDGVETIALTVTCGGDKVLGNPRAVLRG